MQQQVELSSSWAHALVAGDIEAMLDLYHPHVVVEAAAIRTHGVKELEQALRPAWRKLTKQRILATRLKRDQIAIITQYGDWICEHELQIYDGQIRAHRVTLRPAA